MRERELLHELRLLSRDQVRLFRNTQGYDREKRIRYGLAPGSSDLIGWTSMVVTPKWVGNEVAVFTALESKSTRGRASEEQQAFIDTVRRAGGIAGVVRTLQDAYELLRV